MIHVSRTFSKDERTHVPAGLLVVLMGVLGAGCATETLDEAPPTEETATQTDELRRWDFDMDRSLQVLGPGSGWQTAPLIAWTRPITFSTLTGPLRDRGVTSLTNLSWVGDANSYIDVFDNPLGIWFSFPIFPGTPGTPTFFDGASSARFVRHFYPHPSNAQLSIFGTSIPRALNVALPADRQWQAVRHYDRGECSAESSWSSILNPIVMQLTSKLNEQLGPAIGGVTRRGAASGGITLKVGTWGRLDNFDTFGLKASFDVARCGAIMDLSLTGHFNAVGGLPTFSVDSVSAPIDFQDDFCAGWVALAAGHGFNAGALQDRIRGEVESALRTQFGPAVQEGMLGVLAQDPGVTLSCVPGDPGDARCLTLLRAGLTIRGETAAADALSAANAQCLPQATRGLCKFVPTVRRVNTRGDGIEVVLAERQNDPFYNLYRGAGICDRPEGSRIPALSSSFARITIP